MRSLLKALVLLSLLLSCSKEDDSILLPRNKQFSISIPDNFYDETPELKTSGHVYITDDIGNPIIDEELSNSTITDLITESNTDKFDVTFLTKIERLDVFGNTQTIYELKTFANVNPDTIELKEPDSKKYSDVEIIINNADGHLTDFTGSFSSSSSINKTDIKSTVDRVPGNFFVSFKHEHENLRRYVLLEDIFESSTFTYEFDELPVVEQTLLINYPTNDMKTVTIEGALESEPNYFFAPLARSISNSGEQELNFNIPTNLFYNFKVTTSLQFSGGEYYTIEITPNIEEVYSKPDLDLQVVNNTIQNYEISSSSVYDFYRLAMWYSHANYIISWVFCGQSQANIKLTVPEILHLLDIGIEEPSLSDFNELSPSILKLEGIKSYNEYIVYEVSPTSIEENGIVKYESYRK